MDALKELLLQWVVIVLTLRFFGYATKYIDGFNPMVIATWIALAPVVLYVAHRTLRSSSPSCSRSRAIARR